MSKSSAQTSVFLSLSEGRNPQEVDAFGIKFWSQRVHLTVWHRTWVCVMFSDIRTSWKDEIVPTYCYSALRGVLSHHSADHVCMLFHFSRILAAITLWDRVSSLSTTLFLPATCLLGYLTVMTTVAVQVLLDIQQWNQRRPPQLDCLLEVFGFSLSFAFYLFFCLWILYLK